MKGIIKIKVCDRKIGDGEPPFIIAEAGINHNGKIDLAEKLIREAKKSGADAVKFQILKAEEICSQKSSYYDLFKSLEFDAEDWKHLAGLSENHGIIFMASVFGKGSADILDYIGSPAIKIASADITYHQLLDYVARKNKPVFLSTGMASWGEIEEAINVILKAGNNQIALLHCISNYPANPKELNMRTIKTLKRVFGFPVGFSDHSLGIIAAVIAVTLGSNIIEKHFTLDKNLPGPDHKFSLDPIEFAEMVKDVKMAVDALGNGIKAVTDAEQELKKIARRGLFARRTISKGAVVTEHNIKIVRPMQGIDPRFADLVIGRKVKRDIAEDEPIKWTDLC